MDFYTRIVKAKLFIDEHYASNVSLAALCNEACFSKYHFLRLFKKTYNRTPYQYLSECRLEKAKQLLKENSRQVVEVCEQVGFESPTSFAQKFKQYTGETPALFRLRAMQTKKLLTEEPDRFIPSCFSTMFDPEKQRQEN
jgi:AraC-like DNA-binding protein